MQTRDQLYASSVYTQVQDVKKTFVNDYRKYGVMCHKLPILIHTAGLAQALAFVESRSSKDSNKDKNDVYKQLLKDLRETLKNSLNGEKDIVALAREADLTEYMRLTQQVMATLVWYKRCAQSILGVDGSEQEDEASA